MPITDVIASYGRGCVHPALFDRFYEIFLAGDPSDVRPDELCQTKALLREGVSIFLIHVEGKPVGMACLSRSRSRTAPNG